ncbi:MAG: 3-dehydroquinate synthase [Pseudomonadota bacterium]|nr:3-dehydroquinate synthase [Pseudomonadota bacterium]
MTRLLEVALPGQAYPIIIGHGLLADPAAHLLPALARPQVALVSNTTVAPIYAQPLAARLREHGVQVLEIDLPDGEVHKTRASFDHIHDRLLEARFERKATVVAVGGGVVGDLAGYAAATFLRGVAFIQVPTTLLAQVDSSVGGKTGLNHPLGKNLIGAFHQPRLVLADLDTLATLPEREFRAGLAEVLKYGFIRDGRFLAWLEERLDDVLARDPAALVEAVYQSCRNKAEVVVADERESGERALLNLGHTFGHAIEAGLGFGSWLHGEAVAAGMVLAAEVSCAAGMLDRGACERIGALIARAGLPVQAPDLGFERWLTLMGSDKKVDAGRVRFVLLNAADHAMAGCEVPADVLRRCLSAGATAIAA